MLSKPTNEIKRSTVIQNFISLVQNCLEVVSHRKWPQILGNLLHYEATLAIGLRMAFGNFIVNSYSRLLSSYPYMLSLMLS